MSALDKPVSASVLKKATRLLNPVVKTFSATMARDREVVGDKASDWLRQHPEVEVLEIRTLQSSDAQFHCLTIVIVGEVAA